MKKPTFTNYVIPAINTHLINVLNNAYFLELGTIDLKCVNNILKGEKCKITDLYSSLITNNGTGRIYPTNTDEEKRQLSFLKNFAFDVNKNTFLLTFGTISFRTTDGTIYISPIVLVPVELNEKLGMLKMVGMPTSNSILLRYLKEQNLISDSDFVLLNKIPFNNIQTFFEIDEICLKYKEITKFQIGTESYLSTVETLTGQFNSVNKLLSVQHSIHEADEFALYEEYYKNIKAISPQNITQKYVVLKAHHGESFAVNGRLGTGKTETILNIITNSIAHEKKVLYVNTDADRLYYLMHKFDDAGIGEYVQFLYEDYDFNQTVPALRYVENETNIFKILNSLKEMKENDSEKFFGYTFGEILSQIAYYKAINLSTNVKVESVLDKYETNTVEESLSLIEEKLQYVTPLKDNLWTSIATSAGQLSASDISKRVLTFSEAVNNLGTMLDEFTTKFHLASIPTINSLNHFLPLLNSVKNFRPLLSWKTKEDVDNLFSSLSKIDSYISSFNKFDAIYLSKMIPEYEKGSMKELYTKLNISEDLFELRIFDDVEHFDTLIEKIANLTDTTDLASSTLSAYFNLSKFTDEFVRFFNHLYEYLSTGSLVPILSKFYITEHTAFEEEKDKVVSLYERYRDIKKELEIYVDLPIKYEDLSDIEVASCERILKKRYKKYFKNGSNEQCINLLKNMLSVGNKLEIYNPAKKNASFEKEDIWNKYYNFICFIDSLELTNLHLFEVFLKKNKDVDNVINTPIYSKLASLKECTIDVPYIKEELLYYNLGIGSESFLSCVESLKKVLIELKRIQKIRDKIRSMFKDPSVVNPEEIEEVIILDQDYFDLKNKLDFDYNIFSERFGGLYQELLTDTKKVRNYIIAYKFLCEYKLDDYDIFFNDAVYNDFVSMYDLLDNACSKWVNTLRDFSSCFTGSVSMLQSKTFGEVKNLIALYVKDLDQLEYVYQIEQNVDLIRSYNLNILADMINNSSVCEKIRDKFTLSMMNRYKEIIENKGFELSKINDFMKLCDNLYREEEVFVKNNMVYLRNKLVGDKTNFRLRIAAKKDPIRYRRFEKDNIKPYAYKKVYLATTKDLEHIESMKAFDLVIVDDAHLTSANKYQNLNEANQLIIFGEALYRTSTTNGLMQRINKNTFVNYNKYYTKLNAYYEAYTLKGSRHLSIDHSNIYYILKTNMYNIIDEAILSYKQSKKKIFIYYNSFNTVFSAYKYLYKSLINEHFEDVDNIVNNDIIIQEADVNGQDICDEAYIWYPDFENLEIHERIIKLQNMTYALNTYIVYDNYEDLADIVNLHKRREASTIKQATLIDEMDNILSSKGYLVKRGKGLVDLYISLGTCQIGLIIAGARMNIMYSDIDEYLLYSRVLAKDYNITLVPISLSDLVNDFDRVIRNICNIYSEKKKHAYKQTNVK